MNDKRRRKGGFRQILSVAWGHGGPWERFFVLFLLANLAVVLTVSGLVIWAFLASLWPDEVAWTFVLPFFSFVFFNQAITVPLYSDRVLLEALRRGWMGPHEADEEFYRELARYKEAHGKGGRLPGDMAWGCAAWALFYAELGMAVAYGFALRGALGSWTSISFTAIGLPIGLAFFIAYGRRATRQLKEAEARGFPLMQLYRNRSDVVRARSAGR